MTFILFAVPLASAATPVEFLLEPWGAVGQWFPPGAGATLLRELSYFPAADTAFVVRRRSVPPGDSTAATVVAVPLASKARLTVWATPSQVALALALAHPRAFPHLRHPAPHRLLARDRFGTKPLADLVELLPDHRFRLCRRRSCRRL